MLRLFVLLAALLCVQAAALAQQPDSTYHGPRAWRNNELGLLVGLVQGRYTAAEIGVSHNIFGTMHHPFALNYDAAVELSLHDRALIGTKLGVWVSGGVAIGAQAIWYTNGTDNAAVLRPEFGIGIFKAKITYGYDLRVAGPSLPGMNTHVLSVTYCFRVKHFKKGSY